MLRGASASLFACVCAFIGVASADQVGLGWDLWFAESTSEVIEAVELQVISGTVPSWLVGSLVRTGSGRYQVGNHSYNHIFDGDAKLSKFTFDGQKVLFQTRFVETEIYKESNARGDIAPHLTLLPAVPPWTNIPQVSVALGPTDAANINIWHTGNETMASCEQLVTTTFDLKTLTTIGHTNLSLDGGTPSDQSSTIPQMSGAHQSRVVGTKGSSAASFGWSGTTVDVLHKPKITVHRDEQQPDGTLTRTTIGETTMDWVPMIHSFPVTENYVVIPQYPVQLSMVSALMHRDVMDGIQWTGDKNPAYLHVFDVRKGNKAPPVKVFQTDAFMAMHQVNAYDEVKADGSRVLHFDCIGYDDGFLMTHKNTFGNLEFLQDPSCCGNITGDTMKLRHYALDMSTEDFNSTENPVSKKVSWNITHLWDSAVNDEVLVELPRINDDYHGKPYCFFYTGASFPKNSPTNKDPRLIKVNKCGPVLPNLNGSYGVQSWAEPNNYPSEAIFVPRPGASTEDDGVLLSTVFDGVKESSYLLILDGHSMQPVAKLSIPVRIPYDVHGRFFPGV